MFALTSVTVSCSTSDNMTVSLAVFCLFDLAFSGAEILGFGYFLFLTHSPMAGIGSGFATVGSPSTKC